MANISVTYSFSNGTTADADEVNQNFTDIINGTSDGTKDFSINALTCAGTATLNGNVTLGNASGDDVTITGSIAGSIAIKTTNSYDLGSSSAALRYIYLSAGGTYTVRLAAGTASANWNLTIPTAAGTKGQALYDSDGSGTLGWAPLQTDINAVSSDNYTVLDDDGYRHIHMTTAASDRTVTLPTASANTDRILTIKKVDSGAGKVTVDGEGAETIDGATTIILYSQYDSATLVCDGSGWHRIGNSMLPDSYVRVSTPNGHGSTNNRIRRFTSTTASAGSDITFADSASNGSTFTINRKGIYVMSYTDESSAGETAFGISVNSSELTTTISSITPADRLIFTETGSANNYSSTSVSALLNAGDVVRAHTNGSPNATTTRAQFIITQVSKL